MAYLPILDILRSYFEIKEGDREFVIKKKMAGRERFVGFLKVDRPGVHRIWFRPDQDGSLAIGGKVFVRERKQTATVMPYVFDVPLRAGFHPLAITHDVRDSRLREGTPRLEFEWAGPPGERARVPASALFHARGAGPPRTPHPAGSAPSPA